MRGCASVLPSVSGLLWILITISLLVSPISCARKVLDTDSSAYQIQDPWYDWPIEDSIEIIQRVKDSKNNEMNSSRLFRSFEVHSHILPQNLDSFNSLKKRFLEDIEVNKYIQSSLLSNIKYEAVEYTQFRFTPPSLDFKETSLCVSVVKQVEMKNLLLEEVTLLGITAETPNFIAGVVSNEVLQPGESITIDVLYFPRVLDHVEDFLTVLTSAGHYSFHVQGTGILNPYLLTPLVDKHIAADTSYAPSIEVFNPTSETLQIVKLFTTGGFLNLPYQGDTPIEFWQVNPYETRSIIRLNFLSPNPSSYRGMVNIVTHDEFVITLPVEISVHQNELVCNPAAIDFGVHVSYKHSSTRELSILNAQTYPVLVTSIQTAKEDSFTKISFSPLILAPGATTLVATLTHISQAKGSFRGSLRIYTNDSNPHFAEIHVPYYGQSIWGSIQFNHRDTSFLIKQVASRETRVIPLVHHFPSPLIVYGADITSEAFRVIDCAYGDVINPNTPWSGITVQYSGFVPLESSNVLTITTNLTTLEIPLVAYHGKLEFTVMEQLDPKRIDFGILALNEISMRVVNVSNPNPVHIQVNTIAISLPRLQVRLEGVYNAIGKRKDNSEFQGSQFTLESGHYALFILQVICTSEEMGLGFLTFQYNEKQTLEIPVSYHSMKGTLNLLPGQLQFSPSFPGRILQKSISVKSTYSKPVYIQSIVSSDARIIPITLNATIPPHKRMDIATVFFNPSLGPPDENYMVSLSSQVLNPSPDDQYALQIDRRIISHRDNIWNRVVSDSSDIIQGTITINTDVISGHSISFKAPLTRPSIIRESSYDFELTQIGATSQMMIPVNNPSDQPLQVQLYSINAPSEFLLPSEGEQPYFLPPRSSSSVGPIYFLPQYSHETKMSLYLKNNLTVLEMLNIHGQGGSGLFVFAAHNQTLQQRLHDTPRLLDSLIFNLTPSHMEQCLNETNPQLQVSKTFIGINKGNLAVQVHGLSINYGGCKDYGFKVSPCGPFILQPNEEVNISVSFSPDFSSSIVKRSLIVSTAQGDISFPLEAEMPFDWLSVCADSQPLSTFQQSIRRAFVILSVIIFLIFCCYLIRENYFAGRKKQKLEFVSVVNGADLDRELSISPTSLFHVKRLEMPNEEHFATSIDEFVAALPVRPKKPKKKKIIKPVEEKTMVIIPVTSPKVESKRELHSSLSEVARAENASEHIVESSVVIETTTKIDMNVTSVQNREISQKPEKSRKTDLQIATRETKTSNSIQSDKEKNNKRVSPKKTKQSPDRIKKSPQRISGIVQAPVAPTIAPISSSVSEKTKIKTPDLVVPKSKVSNTKNRTNAAGNLVYKPKQIQSNHLPGVLSSESSNQSKSTTSSLPIESKQRKDTTRGNKERRKQLTRAEKRKAKKEKVWEPKKILSRPQPPKEPFAVHSDEDNLEQNIAAIIDEDSPAVFGSRPPVVYQESSSAILFPWNYSPSLGVSMLRPDDDSLVDATEMERRKSAGVIGQVTPPKMDYSPFSRPAPLETLFSRNPLIFTQSESLFSSGEATKTSPTPPRNNQAADEVNSPSHDEDSSETFSSVYQLF